MAPSSRALISRVVKRNRSDSAGFFLFTSCGPIAGGADLARFPEAFGEKLSPSNVEAEIQQRITNPVQRYFAPLTHHADPIEEEAARLCALGNRAACD